MPVATDPSPIPPQLWKLSPDVAKGPMEGAKSTPLRTTDVAFNNSMSLDNPSKYNCDISYYNSKPSKSLSLALCP